MKHLSDEMLEGFRLKALEPGVIVRLSDHLAECAECRMRLADASGAWDAMSELRNDYLLSESDFSHPSDVEIVRYLRSQINDVDREIIESHFETCTRCDEARKEIPALITAQRDVSVKPAFSRWALPLAAAAAITIGVGSGWLFSRQYKRESAELRAKVGEIERSNDDLRQKLAAATTTAPPASSNPNMLVAELRDGENRITLDRSGTLSGLPSISSTAMESVRRALQNGAAEVPAGLSALGGRKGQLLGGSETGSIRLFEPVGKVVLSQRPSFRWSQLDGAEDYVVTVYDSDLKVFAKSESQSRASWQLPLSLRRGAEYGWTVTARKDGKEIIAPAPPAPEARFRVVTTADTDAIQAARADKQSSHLLLGIVYAKAGLLSEAEREFSALLKQNPDSTIAKALLENLRRSRN